MNEVELRATSIKVLTMYDSGMPKDRIAMTWTISSTIDAYFEVIEMKTERIEEFADKHGLIMQVHKRSNAAMMTGLKMFWAAFKHAETTDGLFLTSKHGNGDTEEEAISSYAIEISGKLLVINAYGNNRREIDVPILR